MDIASPLIEGDVTKDIKNFITSTKIKTKDGFFIEIKDIKLKIIMKITPDDLTPPTRDKILMAPLVIQHFVKLNLLGVIFALKNTSGTTKLFVKTMKRLIAVVNSHNLNKVQMKVPSIGAINNILKSDLIQQDLSGLISVQFDKFSKEMFLRLCHVITFNSDAQEHLISVTQSLYEENSHFESSLLLQILTFLFEEDINSLDEVTSSTKQQHGPNIKQSSYQSSESGIEGNDSGSETELINEVIDDNQSHKTSNQTSFIIVERNGHLIPDLEKISISSYKKVMNIPKSLKPVSDSDLRLSENEKLLSNPQYRMQAVYKVSVAHREKRIQLAVEQQPTSHKLDHELPDLSYKTVILSNLNPYQYENCGPGLVQDIVCVCQKFDLLTDSELRNSVEHRTTKVLNFDRDQVLIWSRHFWASQSSTHEQVDAAAMLNNSFSIARYHNPILHRFKLWKDFFKDQISHSSLSANSQHEILNLYNIWFIQTLLSLIILKVVPSHDRDDGRTHIQNNE